MDRVTPYDQPIRTVLDWLAAPLRKIPKPGVETVTLYDPPSGHYLLLRVGWHDGKRVRNTVAHVRVTGGRVYLEEDSTDAQVVDRLVAAGVPREAIVLAFHPPELRHLTDFAVA